MIQKENMWHVPSDCFVFIDQHQPKQIESFKLLHFSDWVNSAYNVSGSERETRTVAQAQCIEFKS